jgi:hypothetical protein
LQLAGRKQQYLLQPFNIGGVAGRGVFYKPQITAKPELVAVLQGNNPGLTLDSTAFVFVG